MSHTQRVPVLMYHRVGAAHNAWEARYASAPTASLRTCGHWPPRLPGCRDRRVRGLAGRGRRVAEGAFLADLRRRFRGVREHALPVLESLRWPFTVFLVSDLIGAQDVWTRQSNPSGETYPLLDADEIRDMQGAAAAFIPTPAAMPACHAG